VKASFCWSGQLILPTVVTQSHSIQTDSLTVAQSHTAQRHTVTLHTVQTHSHAVTQTHAHKTHDIQTYKQTNTQPYSRVGQFRRTHRMVCLWNENLCNEAVRQRLSGVLNRAHSPDCDSDPDVNVSSDRNWSFRCPSPLPSPSHTHPPPEKQSFLRSTCTLSLMQTGVQPVVPAWERIPRAFLCHVLDTRPRPQSQRHTRTHIAPHSHTVLQLYQHTAQPCHTATQPHGHTIARAHSTQSHRDTITQRTDTPSRTRQRPDLDRPTA